MNHMRTIGSRKISASNSDAYAPQRTTVPEPLRSDRGTVVMIRSAAA
jgi:hypothetical protein